MSLVDSNINATTTMAANGKIMRTLSIKLRERINVEFVYRDE
jgi:hypothetical protein